MSVHRACRDAIADQLREQAAEHLVRAETATDERHRRQARRRWVALAWASGHVRRGGTT